MDINKDDSDRRRVVRLGSSSSSLGSVSSSSSPFMNLSSGGSTTIGTSSSTSTTTLNCHRLFKELRTAVRKKSTGDLGIIGENGERGGGGDTHTHTHNNSSSDAGEEDCSESESWEREYKPVVEKLGEDSTLHLKEKEGDSVVRIKSSSRDACTKVLEVKLQLKPGSVKDIDGDSDIAKSTKAIESSTFSIDQPNPPPSPALSQSSNSTPSLSSSIVDLASSQGSSCLLSPVKGNKGCNKEVEEGTIISVTGSEGDRSCDSDTLPEPSSDNQLITKTGSPNLSESSSLGVTHPFVLRQRPLPDSTPTSPSFTYKTRITGPAAETTTTTIARENGPASSSTYSGSRGSSSFSSSSSFLSQVEETTAASSNNNNGYESLGKPLNFLAPFSDINNNHHQNSSSSTAPSVTTMLSSLASPASVDVSKPGRYEVPFRRGSSDDGGPNDDANRVRRGGQLGAAGAAGMAPLARLPARFNTASRAVAAATWRPKEPRLSVLPTGSPTSAADHSSGVLGSSALGGHGVSGPGAGFPSGAGGFGGFGRVPPSSPRGGLGLAGGFMSPGGCGPIPTTTRGQQAGVRRVDIVVPDNAVGYCFVRPDGNRTRLIPADLLPFSLQGVPAVENDNPNLVELPVPVGIGPDGRNTNTQRLVLSPQRGRNADAIQASYNNSPASAIGSPHAPTGPGSQSKRTKIYCDKWVHEGVCAFTQQGCKYKHEMPMDKATQFSLGLFHGLPTWWKKSQAELSAPQSADENYPIARGTTRSQSQQQMPPHQSPIRTTFGTRLTNNVNLAANHFTSAWQPMNSQVVSSAGSYSNNSNNGLNDFGPVGSSRPMPRGNNSMLPSPSSSDGNGSNGGAWV